MRRIAIEKIDEAPVLADIAAAETERSLREFAGERAAQLYASTACKDNEDAAENALSGITKLGDQHALIDVAVHAKLSPIRKKAFEELRDPKALAELAKDGDAPQDIRAAAVARIDDGDVLRAIAIDTTIKETGLAAVEKLDDVERLENVANKAKNKAVRQRARKIVTEITASEKAKQKSTVPDDVKRRRAEKAQLVRELEGLADTFDFAKASVTVKAAQDAWSKLEGADDGDDRFTKAVERFWKRKEIHESQARSADELRAVEREAQRERERASAEREAKDREAKIPDDIETVGEPVASDAARAAREAEAKARREERDKRKAEDDARRAEEQAARDARKKEDAERGVAIAAALTAMVEDMEKLGADGNKDTRGIDRLLQQAGKAFGDIGKVPSDQRDALSDRYTKARGKLVVRASELREAQDWQRFQNVPKAEALISTAKDMLAEEPSPELGNRLRGLQALWKEVGPMPQRRSKELWEQFKSLCDQVYDKVKGFRAVESEKFSEVAKAKEALIAEAESLADSTDWQATANKLKDLQARWKQSGHLPRKQGDELWNKFRAACDKFFERRKPQLDAQHAEEAQNLAAKQALIAKATTVAANAPGEGGWGKAIAEIKKLQQQWKEIGFVPRRDADAVYKAFRAACDSLFAKRDESRDAEANAHRDAIDDVKAEIADVLIGGDDIVAKALAVRTKAEALDSRELSQSIEQMIRHVVTANPDAVKGTELDPQAAKNRRDKLIAKAEELLPKQPTAAVTAESNPADIAAQLKQAMRSNAFGDLRFSGRDPVEVVDDLRGSWMNAGPILDDDDRAQATRFEDTIKRVLDAAGAAARADRDSDDRGAGGEGEGRRRRRRDERGESRGDRAEARRDDRGEGRRDDRTIFTRERRPAAGSVPPVGSPSADAAATTAAVVSAAAFGAPAAAAALTDPPLPPSPPAPAAVPAAAAAAVTAIPHTAHDAITAPAKIPFEPMAAPEVPSAALSSPSPSPEPSFPPVSSQTTPVVEPPRQKTATMQPPMDELDDAWDMPDDDPTASNTADLSADADAAMKRPEPEAPPSSSEMAGDGAVAGDGIDEPGWD